MRKNIIIVGGCMLMLAIMAPSAQATTTFAVQASDHSMVCNDSAAGPDTARKTSVSDIRNYGSTSATRRRVAYYQYDISTLKTAEQDFANCYLTVNVDKSDSTANTYMYVYALNEDIDNLTPTGLTWNTAPGVVNSPAPDLGSEITIDTLDTADLSSLVMSFHITTLDVWESTAVASGLTDILNADTDGILTLMFICYSPQNTGYEICSPSHSRSLAIGDSIYKGIIIQGDVVPEPASMLMLALGSLLAVRTKQR